MPAVTVKYRQLVDGSVHEWGTISMSPGSDSISVSLTGGHSTAPTITLTVKDFDVNVNLASVTKDVFMVESSIPGVKFAFYAVSKP
jgi:hypothetical protein